MANLRLLVIHLRRRVPCWVRWGYLYIMNEIYTADFDERVGCLLCKWTGYATSKQFREGMLIQLGMLIARQCDKMLVDLKDMVIIGREDQEWMDRTYMPLAIQGGLRMVAIVPSAYYFNKVAVESVVFRIDQAKVTVNYFSTVDEAKTWFSPPVSGK